MAYSRAIILLAVISVMIARFDLVASLSAYNVLQNYGLPVGLLPEGVGRYDLNPNTGQFKAYLNGDCRFTIQSRSIKYSPVVEGVISNGRLENLEGVEVRVLLFWVGIKQVVRDGDQLIFTSTISSAEFPVGDFGFSPRC
ncbi:hypothetical protein M5689_004335 [Euphorbia peplus]|nr:hypothetical protein M5689_004335 [Euphorbia peplus]